MTGFKNRHITPLPALPVRLAYLAALLGGSILFYNYVAKSGLLCVKVKEQA